MKIGKLALIAPWLLPVVAAAQSFNGGYFEDIAGSFVDIINMLIPAFIGLLLIYFFWGLAKYVKGGDEKAMAEARSTMIHGVIAIFAAAAIWGLVNLLVDITGADNNTVNLPDILN
jgi:predicted Na+-dependent transporter